FQRCHCRYWLVGIFESQEELLARRTLARRIADLDGTVHDVRQQQRPGPCGHIRCLPHARAKAPPTSVASRTFSGTLTGLRWSWLLRAVRRIVRGRSEVGSERLVVGLVDEV